MSGRQRDKYFEVSFLKDEGCGLMEDTCKTGQNKVKDSSLACTFLRILVEERTRKNRGDTIIRVAPELPPEFPGTQ